MRDRSLNLNIRIDEDEKRKLRAVAEAGDETAAQVLRRFIRDAYSARFGETPPPRIRRRRKAAKDNTAAETK